MTDQSSNTSHHSGSCLCGKISFAADFKAGAGACHCGMCRKWGSGPYMGMHAVGKVEFEGSDHVGLFKSSEWAERGFCKNCGTSLFYHLLPRPEMPDGEYIISAGMLAEQQNLSFDHEVYVDHAPGWYGFSNEKNRQRMTEAELLAMFMPDAK